MPTIPILPRKSLAIHERNTPNLRRNLLEIIMISQNVPYVDSHFTILVFLPTLFWIFSEFLYYFQNRQIDIFWYIFRIPENSPATFLISCGNFYMDSPKWRCWLLRCVAWRHTMLRSVLFITNSDVALKSHHSWILHALKTIPKTSWSHNERKLGISPASLLNLHFTIDVLLESPWIHIRSWKVLLEFFLNSKSIPKLS